MPQAAVAAEAVSSGTSDASSGADVSAGADAQQPQVDTSQTSMREVRKARRTQSRSRREDTAQPRFALPSYRELKAQMQGDKGMFEIPAKSQKALQKHMRAFQGSARVQDQALALYVNSQVGVHNTLSNILSTSDSFICLIVSTCRMISLKLTFAPLTLHLGHHSLLYFFPGCK